MQTKVQKGTTDARKVSKGSRTAFKSLGSNELECGQLGNNREKGEKSKRVSDATAASDKGKRRNPRSSNAPDNRIHMKFASADSCVAFNVEHPNRVAVRLEFLMDSTVVRLNDQSYMTKLYGKLVQQEKRTEGKNKWRRKLSEKERVKQLVIKGEMDPPQDMQQLYNHPVYRVNTMLKRLDKHSSNFFAHDKPKQPIIALEPFEFEPTGFCFKKLHGTGEYWVPSDEKLYQQEKIKGKIQRAKQRLLDKRHREAEEARDLTLLYKSQGANVDTNDAISLTEEESQIDFRKNARVRKSEARRKSYADERTEEERAKQVKLEARIAATDLCHRRALARREQQRLVKREERERLHEKVLNAEKEKERQRIVEKHQYRFHRYDRLQSIQHPNHMNDRPDASEFTRLFEMPDTPPHLNEDETFKALRRKYDLRGTPKFDSYRPAKDEFVDQYLDEIDDAREMYNVAKAVTKVYERKRRVADDFMLNYSRIR